MPVSALLVAAALTAAVAGDAQAEWRWFEGNRSFEPLTADPREPRLALEYIEAGDWSAKAGGAVTIASIIGNPLEEARATADAARLLEPIEQFRIGMDGMAWLWLSSLPEYNFPLETVDGTIGLWAETSEGAWGGRLRLYHWSGHLADGASDIEERRIVYSRETVAIVVSRELSRTMRLYGGPAAYLHADPRTQAFQFQLGGRIGAAAPSGTATVDPLGALGTIGSAAGLMTARDSGRPGFYAAFDLRMKAENDYRVNQSYQVGFRFGRTRGNSMRLAAGYTNGMSERGQDWRTPEQFFSIGASFGD
ncbi:MAG: DUF1207 domain-containing protein [Candidatus Eiseniibacteriota bacterium]